MSDIQYVCSVCGKKTTAKKGEDVPACCGQPMEPLPFCTVPPNPEMVRNYDSGEPCDDGTIPRKR